LQLTPTITIAMFKIIGSDTKVLFDCGCELQL